MLPHQDDFLLPDDDEAVLAYLQHLQEERANQAAKQQEQEEQGVDKHPAWVNLHMSLAEKRPLYEFRETTPCMSVHCALI